MNRSQPAKDSKVMKMLMKKRKVEPEPPPLVDLTTDGDTEDEFQE